MSEPKDTGRLGAFAEGKARAAEAEHTETARRVLEDLVHAAQRGADTILRHEGQPNLEEVRAQITKARAEGAVIVGCSFCARNRPTGDCPRPCPVCGRMVSPSERAEVPDGG